MFATHAHMLYKITSRANACGVQDFVQASLPRVALSSPQDDPFMLIPSPQLSDWQRSGERRDRPKSRFGRIVQRVSYVMRRVVLGHVPARDEASTRSRVTGVHGAQRTDHSYARSGIAKVNDPTLQVGMLEC